MNVSRIDKFLRECTSVASIAEAHGLRDRPLELVFGPETHPDLVRPAVALALRCFIGAIHLRVDGGGPDLASAADEARSYGADARVRTGAGPAGCLQLGIGKAIAGVFVDAAGGEAFVNSLATARSAPWPPAATFAAACGFAKLFAQLRGAGPEVRDEQFTFSLATFSPRERIGASDLQGDVDLGTIVLIGAGAIGSAFAFILKHAGWRCTLRIVDPESYDEPNHETTLVISKNDAMTHLPKARTLATLVHGDTVKAEAIPERVEEGHVLLDAPCDILVCAVDNPETRRILDRAACGLLLNGAVGGGGLDAGLILWSRHGRDERPLASLYPPLVEPKSNASPPIEVADDECSRVAYEGVALAAPFMALAVASLLAAACVQQALGIQVDQNYLQFDLLELQSKYSERRRA